MTSLTPKAVWNIWSQNVASKNRSKINQLQSLPCVPFTFEKIKSFTCRLLKLLTDLVKLKLSKEKMNRNIEKEEI